METTADREPRREDDVTKKIRKLPYLDIAKETGKEFSDDQVTDIAAGVAYHTIFAIPPAIIFMITLAALVESVTSIQISDRLIEAIETNAPADTQQLLTDIVERAIANVSGGVATFGVAFSALIALWSGSNGVATVMRAFNRAYGVEETRNFVKLKLAAIGLTVLMTVLVIAAFVLFVFGEQIGSWIAERAGLGNAFEVIWNLSRWPAAILFIMFLLAVLYYLGPNIEQSFHWISAGSVVSTILWIIIVLGFKFYLEILNPGSAYGALGSVVVLLFFLYITAIAFLVGAELNAVLQRRYDAETIAHLAAHPEKIEDSHEWQEAIEQAGDLEQR